MRYIIEAQYMIKWIVCCIVAIVIACSFGMDEHFFDRINHLMTVYILMVVFENQQKIVELQKKN